MTQSYHLVCITKNGTNPAYEGARTGARRVAERFGCSIENLYPRIPDDVIEQTELVEKALNDAADAIVLAPAHATELDPVLERINRAGIPLVFFVSGSDGVEPRTMVTSNNHDLARSVAGCLFSSMGGVGEVAIVEGNPNSPTSAPRTDGFLEAASRQAGIHIVARRPGLFQRDLAKRAMIEILKAHPNLGGVLSANDFMALGVLEALEESRRNIPVVGVNAMPEAIQAIKSGRLLATASFDAMKMASVATEAACRILRGERVPRLVELPVEIVDIRNCAAWDQPYETRPLPEWEALSTS